MKVAFCTCVQIGKSCIEAIIDNGGSFELLVTLNDNKSVNKSGRIYLDDICEKYSIPLYKINHINDPDFSEIISSNNIDWLFIIGWSQIASPDVLKVPKKGIIGAHPTLLPVGRGRASIPWAIIKGLNKTGVTFFKMDEGVDTGEILDQYEIPICPVETATTLYSKVNKAHVELIKQIWPKLINDEVVGIRQDEYLATYWAGRKPADGELIKSMTVEDVDRLVRASTIPYPGAFIKLSETQKMIIWSGSIQPVINAKKIEFKNGIYYVTKSEVIEY